MHRRVYKLVKDKLDELDKRCSMPMFLGVLMPLDTDADHSDFFADLPLQTQFLVMKIRFEMQALHVRESMAVN